MSNAASDTDRKSTATCTCTEGRASYEDALCEWYHAQEGEADQDWYMLCERHLASLLNMHNVDWGTRAGILDECKAPDGRYPAGHVLAYLGY